MISSCFTCGLRLGHPKTFIFFRGGLAGLIHCPAAQVLLSFGWMDVLCQESLVKSRIQGTIQYGKWSMSTFITPPSPCLTVMFDT